jgi:hypothetical protein
LFSSPAALWRCAREIIDLLASRLHILAPGVDISEEAGNSYQPNVIVVGRLCQEMSEAALAEVLLHEMAHHVAMRRYLRLNAAERFEQHSAFVCVKLDLPVFHGAAFCKALADVAEAWYGEATRYPWAREAQSVQRWAEQQGYVNLAA